MIINGKAYLTGDRMCELLGWDDGNWSIPCRKQKISHIPFKKRDEKYYFLQSDVYELLKEIEIKSKFLCDVQSLAMYITDSTHMKKTKVAKLLGFKGKNRVIVMNAWLENTTYTETVAKVFLRAKKYFPHCVNQFNKEYII